MVTVLLRLVVLRTDGTLEAAVHIHDTVTPGAGLDPYSQDQLLTGMTTERIAQVSGQRPAQR
jgi:hypothetical protein